MTNFERGQQEALDDLTHWQENGWTSREQARETLLHDVQEQLEVVRELPVGGAFSEDLRQVNIDYYQGLISVYRQDL